ARCSGRCWCPRWWPTCASAAPSATACTSAPRPRYTRSCCRSTARRRSEQIAQRRENLRVRVLERRGVTEHEALKTARRVVPIGAEAVEREAALGAAREQLRLLSEREVEHQVQTGGHPAHGAAGQNIQQRVAPAPVALAHAPHVAVERA